MRKVSKSPEISSASISPKVVTLLSSPHFEAEFATGTGAGDDEGVVWSVELEVDWPGHAGTAKGSRDQSSLLRIRGADKQGGAVRDVSLWFATAEERDAVLGAIAILADFARPRLQIAAAVDTVI